MRRYLPAACLLAVLLLAGCVTLDTPEREEAHVVQVVDGDTVELANGETVRLLGINTPETGEPFSAAATARLEGLVLNRTVQLEAGAEDSDQYGRMLRYIHVNDTLVNRVLVAEGLATTYLLADEDPYRQKLRKSERDARENSRGLWASSSVSGCVAITDVQHDPDGNDNYRLTQEYVTFQNTCTRAIGMDAWTVKDAGTSQYTFDAYTLQPDGAVTLRTGRGDDNATDVYWGQRQAVWNNDGDALYLRDDSGQQVTYTRYNTR
jgi:micrococcal nuclease